MSLRLLCKQNRRLSNALFYFRQEQKTGIAPTRIIIEKQLDLTVGMVVTVNWDGEKVEADCDISRVIWQLPGQRIFHENH